MLTAAIQFDFTTIASDLHPTFRYFGSPVSSDAPFTILRYGQGTVTQIQDLPGLNALIADPGDITLEFGSADVNDVQEVVTLSDFDDGLTDGLANQIYTPDGNDMPELIISHMGTPVIRAEVEVISLEITPENVVTSPASAPSRLRVIEPIGSDTRFYDELLAITDFTGTLEFTLGPFGLTGPWAGVGDAEIFDTEGEFVGLVTPPVQLLEDGTLQVLGTSDADTIEVNETGSSVEVNFNETNYTYAVGDVSQIEVKGAGGNDLVTRVGAGTVMTTMLGGPGLDTLIGGDGPDNLNGGSARDSLVGGDGNDTLLGSGGSDTLVGGPGIDSLGGGTGNDNLSGGPGADVLRGFDGRDKLEGGSANDLLVGGNDDDTLKGGSGNDTVLGGSGNDYATGGRGNDSIGTGSGNDIILGGLGTDTMNGATGRDIVVGGDLADIANGGSGDDILIAGDLSASVSVVKTIRDEWVSENTYAERVDNLRDGTGTSGGGANGSNFLPALVTADDGDADELTGGDDMDYFWGLASEVLDLTGDEARDE